MKAAFKNRKVNAVLGFWLFLNLILYAQSGNLSISRKEPTFSTFEDQYRYDIINRKPNPRKNIFPIEDSSIEYYDLTEFLLYGLSPFVLLLIVGYIKEDK